MAWWIQVVVVVVMVVVLLGNSATGVLGKQGTGAAGSRLEIDLGGGEQRISEREKVIQDLVARHDATIPPNYEDDFPTMVDVQIFLVSFDSISEITMDYSLTIFLRQTWNDSRLSYPPLPGIQALELDSRVMQKIWVPDLYFTNEKHATFHDVTVPNRLMHVYPEGQVLYSARISMKLSCDMNLWKFPFDAQVCHVGMESYGYSAENLVFHWNSNPVQRRQDMSLPQFKLVKYDTMDCTKFYIGANYTCIKVQFYLLRSYGYYMAQVYIPSVLVVVLSWVSFWLDIDAVPARISLGLLTVLTMTTQSASARSNLPRVSYVKAIDVWMAMCLLFVFAALIEFAYVNVNARVERRRQSVHGGLKLGVGAAVEGGCGSGDRKGPGSLSGHESGGEDKNKGRKRLFSKTTVMRQRARTLDKVSRVAFPAVFIVFNTFYWSCYMLLED
ncbi:glycine receptor subunit alphaZ1-like [Babylonia areolata]|uniref:glycine receptor subunit alphaZ1-like n=1 Tax=Babylonia areolata TaxID=304850 RepID=UPI003FD09205